MLFKKLGLSSLSVWWSFGNKSHVRNETDLRERERERGGGGGVLGYPRYWFGLPPLKARSQRSLLNWPRPNPLIIEISLPLPSALAGAGPLHIRDGRLLQARLHGLMRSGFLCLWCLRLGQGRQLSSSSSVRSAYWTGSAALAAFFH